MSRNEVERLRESQLGRLTKTTCSRVVYLHSLWGFLGWLRRLGSTAGHKGRLGRRIREDRKYWPYDQEETLPHHFTPCHNGLIRMFLLFSYLLTQWFVILIYIYSSNTEGPKNKLPLSSPSFCHSRAPLLFLSDWVLFLLFLYKKLYKTSLKGISHFKEDLGICLTRSLTACYTFLG